MAAPSGTGLPTGGIRYFRKFLFDSTITEIDWSLGMMRDRPISAIPPGGSYTVQDFFCDRPGMLYKRGGMSYQNSLLTGYGDIVAISAPPFPGAAKVLALASNGVQTTLFEVTTGATPAAITFGNGAIIEPYENPPYYAGDGALNPPRLIYTDGTGATPPKKVYLNSGTVTVAALGGQTADSAPVTSASYASSVLTVSTTGGGSIVNHGLVVGQTVILTNFTPSGYNGTYTVATTPTTTSFTVASASHGAVTVLGQYTGMPPNATVSCNHIGFLVLGNSPTNPNRIWFSDPIDADNTWDMAGSWIDCDEPIMGLASVQGILLVFSRGFCWRVLGDVPPGSNTTDSDVTMSLEPLGAVGCIDARALILMNNLVYVANEAGIFSSNGAGFTSITNKAKSEGISALWQSKIQGFTPQINAIVCMGSYLDQYLLVSITHNNGTRTAFMYYAPLESWVLTSETTVANMYATGQAPNVELYMGPSNQSSARAVAMSGMWSPSSSNIHDYDGSAVQPSYTSRLISDAPGEKRYGLGHITYKMGDLGSNNPTLEVAQATGMVIDSGFADMIESPLPAISTLRRRRVTLAKDAQGLAYQISQSGPSDYTEIYLIETELAPYYIADGQ